MALLFLPIFCAAQIPEITPTAGQIISKTCKIAPGEYHFDGAETGFESPVLTIKGENVEVDFQGATFLGNGKKELPDQFSGLGIKVEGKKISIKNLKVRGYKIGLLATQTVDFQLVDSEFSYNWRPRLKSTREKEDPTDLLNFQHDHDEWMESGAGIYLKNCPNALVKNCTATGNLNALLMDGCDGGLFYNNNFRFNSGIGIGLFRSSKNRVMHNQLDWNVRGFSQNFYKTGHGSAGVICFEKSEENVFAFNSATHSGNGFWGKQHSYSGQGRNQIYGNDFSYSPKNGIEITGFRSDFFTSNYMDDCSAGIDCRRSSDQYFLKNVIKSCETGFSATGGHDIFIYGNETNFTDNPLKINRLGSVYIDSTNKFEGFKDLLQTPTSADSVAIFWKKKAANESMSAPIFSKLPDGIDANADITNRRGRHWIWMTEWGPYDFRGPICFLKKIDGTRYEFWMNAAGPGNWSVKKAKGFKTLTMTGGFPTKLIAERNPAGGEVYLQFEAVFQNDQVDVFGEKIPAGQPYLFDFQPIK